MSLNQNESLTIRAWDPLLRIFHWSLVFFFLIAFISGDDFLNLHAQAGYAITLLIMFRLFWGLAGTRLARFQTFVKSPSVVLAYFKGMTTFKVPHYLGHNPVAAVMVITLLFSLVLVSFSGMVILASGGQGPLSATIFSSWPAKWMEEIHEFFANFTLLLIFIHIAGVIFSSFLERENLVKAMITGRKKVRYHWQDVKPDEAN
jgi:cytochrome b